RAIEFLAKTQRDDGSWPMTSRNHPGVTSTRNPIRNPVPITYFGSSWATLGLVRYVPPALDLAARQQRAIDAIRMYSGSSEVDEQASGKPVVSVNIVFEVSDEELERLTALLTAFTELRGLAFKSSKITDAGLTHFHRLPQLRSLSLENAAVTD